MSVAAVMRLVGWIDFDGDDAPAFPLPIFRPRDQPERVFVQSIMPLNSVLAGFSVLAEEHLTLHPFQDAPLFVSAGEPPIYVFIDESRQAHAGPLSALKPVLEAFLRRADDWPAVALQAAMLLKEEAIERDHAVRMAQLVRRRSGNITAIRFYRSLMYERLWRRLEESARSEDDRRELWQRRRELVLLEGVASDIRLAAVPSGMQALLGASAAAIEEDLQHFSSAILALYDKVEEGADRGQPAPVAIADRRASREERLVLLIAAALYSPSWERHRAVLERADVLADSVVARAMARQAGESEGQAAVQILDRLVKTESRVVPDRVLYFAAKHLGRRPGVATWVLETARLATSQSTRNMIDQLADHGVV